jgi:hypothetical protein
MLSTPHLLWKVISSSIQPICDPAPLTNPGDRPFAKIRRAGNSFRFCLMPSHSLTCSLAVSHATPPEFFARRSRTAVADKRTDARHSWLPGTRSRGASLATLPASVSVQTHRCDAEALEPKPAVCSPLRSEHPRRGCLGIQTARYGSQGKCQRPATFDAQNAA